MDLIAGVPNVWIVARHCTKEGKPKLVESCTLPVTGLGVVRRVFTDLATMDVADGQFLVKVLAPGIGIDHVRSQTSAPVRDGRPCAG